VLLPVRVARNHQTEWGGDRKRMQGVRGICARELKKRLGTRRLGEAYLTRKSTGVKTSRTSPNPLEEGSRDTNGGYDGKKGQKKK